MKYAAAILTILIAAFGVIYNDIKNNISFAIRGVTVNGPLRLAVLCEIKNETFFNFIFRDIKVIVFDSQGMVIAESDTIDRHRIEKGVSFLPIEFGSVLIDVASEATEGVKDLAYYVSNIVGGSVEVEARFMGIIISKKSKIQLTDG